VVLQLSDVSVGGDRENVVFLSRLQTKKTRAHIWREKTLNVEAVKGALFEFFGLISVYLETNKQTN